MLVRLLQICFEFVGFFEGHAYYLSNYITNWNDAESTTVNNGGYLLVINSQEENTFIVNNVTGDGNLQNPIF